MTSNSQLLDLDILCEARSSLKCSAYFAFLLFDMLLIAPSTNGGAPVYAILQASQIQHLFR
jgi:hypothetical protein